MSSPNASTKTGFMPYKGTKDDYKPTAQDYKEGEKKYDRGNTPYERKRRAVNAASDRTDSESVKRAFDNDSPSMTMKRMQLRENKGEGYERSYAERKNLNLSDADRKMYDATHKNFSDWKKTGQEDNAKRAIPSTFKKGGKVRKTGMAKVHKGERVLTVRQNKGFEHKAKSKSQKRTAVKR